MPSSESWPGKPRLRTTRAPIPCPLFEVLTVKNTPFRHPRSTGQAFLLLVGLPTLDGSWLPLSLPSCLFLRKSSSGTNTLLRIVAASSLQDKGLKSQGEAALGLGNRDLPQSASNGSPSSSHQGGGLCWAGFGPPVTFLLFVNACFTSSTLVLLHWVLFCTRNKSIGTAWHTLLPHGRFRSVPLGLGRHEGIGVEIFLTGRGVRPAGQVLIAFHRAGRSRKRIWLFLEPNSSCNRVAPTDSRPGIP
jgi:hypothetical protein